MKKSLKVVLAALGAMGGIAGLLVWDTISRADRAIEAHEERLAADIDSLRARRKRPGPESFSFEMGRSGQLAAKNAVFAALTPRARYPDDAGSAQLLAALEAIEDALQEGGYAAVIPRVNNERAALHHLRVRLQKQRVEPAECRTIAGTLDRMMIAHPTLREIVDGEALLDRRELLNVIRGGRDPAGILRRRPGWRELFSWKVLVAKALVQLDDLAREIKAVDDLELWVAGDDVAEMLVAPPFRRRASMALEIEPQGRTDWIFTRIVLALVWFKAEKGRPAETLHELVPDYLKEVPLHVHEKRTLKYSGDRVRVGGTSLSWPEKED